MTDRIPEAYSIIHDTRISRIPCLIPKLARTDLKGSGRINVKNSCRVFCGRLDCIVSLLLLSETESFQDLVLNQEQKEPRFFSPLFYNKYQKEILKLIHDENFKVHFFFNILDFTSFHVEPCSGFAS
jgi:hypothetical protein